MNIQLYWWLLLWWREPLLSKLPRNFNFILHRLIPHWLKFLDMHKNSRPASDSWRLVMDTKVLPMPCHALPGVSLTSTHASLPSLYSAISGVLLLCVYPRFITPYQEYHSRVCTHLCRVCTRDYSAYLLVNV